MWIENTLLKYTLTKNVYFTEFQIKFGITIKRENLNAF
jgi:hypothetical protein